MERIEGNSCLLCTSVGARSAPTQRVALNSQKRDFWALSESGYPLESVQSDVLKAICVGFEEQGGRNVPLLFFFLFRTVFEEEKKQSCCIRFL